MPRPLPRWVGEAAARLLSFTAAGQALSLSQSAVSRQIQTLEAHLGLKLFTRGHRAIAFTPEGECLFRSADGAFQQLQDVLGDLRAAGALRPVTVSACIGIAGADRNDTRHVLHGCNAGVYGQCIGAVHGHPLW